MLQSVSDIIRVKFISEVNAQLQVYEKYIKEFEDAIALRTGNK